MERTIKKIALLLLIGCMPFQNLFSQSTSLEKAIERENFPRIEHLMKMKIKKYKNGVEIYNAQTGSMQKSFPAAYDSIVSWLLVQPGISDASWDKCQMKEAIYPGQSTIGIVFKMKNGTVEKCYSIQEGTTGQPDIFGWHPALFKPKMKLVYKGSTNSDGFVEKQKKLCGKYKVLK